MFNFKKKYSSITNNFFPFGTKQTNNVAKTIFYSCDIVLVLQFKEKSFNIFFIMAPSPLFSGGHRLKVK